MSEIFEALQPGTETQKYTVLLVEDTEDTRMLIHDYLEYVGYEVRSAHNGYDGIALVEKIHPDLILMDIRLPGMDGLHAIRHLRENPTFETTPIIAITALAMPGDRERCLAAGASGYVSKPLSLKTLAKLVETMLKYNKPPDK